MKITIESSGNQFGSERYYEVVLPTDIDKVVAAMLKLLEALTVKAQGRIS